MLITQALFQRSLSRSALHAALRLRKSFPSYHASPIVNGHPTTKTSFTNDAFRRASSYSSQGIKQTEEAWVPSLRIAIPGHCSSIDPFKLVASDLEKMTRSVKATVSVLQHPLLDRAASHLLSLQGKRFRPIMVLLMAHSTAMMTAASCGAPVHPGLLPSQLRLAEITELIHAASLLHDDVIDAADTRRGVLSVNSTFGNQLAVLAGDFLLARASVALARLRDCDVVELLSTVIEHLVRGEVLQMKGGVAKVMGGIGDALDYDEPRQRLYHSPQTPFDAYLAKTFFKTASLIANSCRAVTMLAGHPKEVTDVAYRYGESVGIAFQLIDDMLDMTASSDILGKPVLNDLRQGHATAPVLFARDQFPTEIQTMMDRRFCRDGDIERTVELVEQTNGLEKTRDLAQKHVHMAVEELVAVLPPSDHRSALVNLADLVLTRNR